MTLELFSRVGDSRLIP